MRKTMMAALMMVAMCIAQGANAQTDKKVKATCDKAKTECKAQAKECCTAQAKECCKAQKESHAAMQIGT